MADGGLALEEVLVADAPDAVPITTIGSDGFEDALANLGERAVAAATAHRFKGASGQVVVLAKSDGATERVIVGIGREGGPDFSPFQLGILPHRLEPRTYRLDPAPATTGEAALAALGWCLGAYRYDRLKTSNGEAPASLVCPEGVDRGAVLREAAGTMLARDLVNAPAGDLGPAELAEAALGLADRFGASARVIEGRELEEGFPMIHAVGAAATPERGPRLVDLAWGEEDAPKVTLVGKGVVFDTGGLDIKPAAAMLLMKKDMGGAANVLGLAQMIMDAGLKLRLRVLIPAVENAISGAAFRPGDVLRSRKGQTVEIGNTDAEGRLVLADALALADEEAPELVVSMATLTGAARVALGPDLPPLYAHDDPLAAALVEAGMTIHDPLWRMPLWAPYDTWLKSKVADLSHISSGPFAGSITAALFLNRFVERATSYAHLDIYAWTPAAKPGRPEGGEAQGIRALFSVMKERYG